jgi:A/G-specific adenine glycosylase
MGLDPTDMTRTSLILPRILAWGRQHRRPFPWRGERDPYKLLVAEILLQRSRSGTVADVYATFIARWPTATDLVSASVSDVRHLLYPIGFAKRAVALQNLATIYLSWADTVITHAKLCKLPGVGKATASSVTASLGLGQVPIDSVSGRVYERAFGLVGDRLVETLTDGCNVLQLPTDELNWSTLDLAASTCLPKRPRCGQCPINEGCDWWATNQSPSARAAPSEAHVD